MTNMQIKSHTCTCTFKLHVHVNVSSNYMYMYLPHTRQSIKVQRDACTYTYIVIAYRCT